MPELCLYFASLGVVDCYDGVSGRRCIREYQPQAVLSGVMEGLVVFVT